MTNKEPTGEQIRRLWEWCDCLEIKQFPTTHPMTGNHILVDAYVWKPTGSRLGQQIGVSDFPPPDLNNLFQWVVPKLQGKGYMVELYSCEQSGYKVAIYHITGQVDIPVTIVKLNDPALALFWAIWQIVEEKEKVEGYRHTSIGDNIRDGFS